jgi:hypothetical protein
MKIRKAIQSAFALVLEELKGDDECRHFSGAIRHLLQRNDMQKFRLTPILLGASL